MKVRTMNRELGQCVSSRAPKGLGVNQLTKAVEERRFARETWVLAVKRVFEPELAAEDRRCLRKDIDADAEWACIFRRGLRRLRRIDTGARWSAMQC